MVISYFTCTFVEFGWLAFPREVVSVYKAAGYDIVSITDHSKLTQLKDEGVIFLPTVNEMKVSRGCSDVYLDYLLNREVFV